MSLCTSAREETDTRGQQISVYISQSSGDLIKWNRIATAREGGEMPVESLLESRQGLKYAVSEEVGILGQDLV